VRNETLTDNDAIPIAQFRTPDGLLVAEVDLSERPSHVHEFVARARKLGADRLWVYAHVVDVGLGFTLRGSYTRLIAQRPPAPIELPYPPWERISELRRACLSGIWGHRDPGPPDDELVYVALYEGGEWVGICQLDPARQWIDGPCVVPSHRTPERYAKLVRGAAAYLSKEPVLLETRGDAASTLAAYQSLGFEIAQTVAGWELDLRTPS
jgi:hypothetical protein